MSSLQALYDTLSFKNSKLVKVDEKISQMEDILLKNGSLSDPQRDMLAAWRKDSDSLSAQINDLTQKITELTREQEKTKQVEEKTKQEEEKTKQTEAEVEKVKEMTKQVEIHEVEETKRRAKEQEEETRRVELETLTRRLQVMGTSSIGARNHTQFWNDISSNRVKSLILPRLPDQPAPLPTYWGEVQDLAVKEVPNQNKLHELIRANGGHLVPQRTFVNGNDAGNQLLGLAVKPDEYVFEDDDTGSLANTLLLVEWKAPKEELGNGERGQAVNEGQYFLQKTGRPFIHVLLSNFHQFVFFKVEQDPAALDGFSYNQSKDMGDIEGFANLHNLLSQKPADLGSNFLPTITGVTVGCLLGKGATSFVYEGVMTDRNTAVAVKFVQPQFESEAENEVAILRKLGRHLAGVPTIPFPDKLPPRIVVLSPVLSKPVSISWNQAKELIVTLKYVHGQNYLHRDLRPDNVMCSAKRIYLVDFGFAISKGKVETYSGTVTTASDRVLGILATNRQERFEFKEADDVQSLVKTIYLLNSPAAHATIPPKDGPNAYNEIFGFWQRCPPTWKRALASTTLTEAEAALEEHFRK